MVLRRSVQLFRFWLSILVAAARCILMSFLYAKAMPGRKPVKVTYTNFPKGVLRVGVGCARGIRGDELLGFGRSDPYAKIIFGPTQATQEFVTATDKNAGEKPYWGEWFTLPVKVPDVPENNELVVQIFNQNHLRADNQIGYSRLTKLGELVMGCDNFSTGDVWHTVYDPGTHLPRGEIMLSFRFEMMDDLEFNNWISDQESAHKAPVLLNSPRWRRKDPNADG